MSTVPESRERAPDVRCRAGPASGLRAGARAAPAQVALRGGRPVLPVPRHRADLQRADQEGLRLLRRLRGLDVRGRSNIDPMPFALFIPFVLIFGWVDAWRSATAINNRFLGGKAEPEDEALNSPVWGGILVAAGALLLLHNLGWLDLARFQRFWPVLLILAGGYFIRQSIEARKLGAGTSESGRSPSARGPDPGPRAGGGRGPRPPVQLRPVDFLETVRAWWPLSLVVWGVLEVVQSLTATYRSGGPDGTQDRLPPPPPRSSGPRVETAWAIKHNVGNIGIGPRAAASSAGSSTAPPSPSTTRRARPSPPAAPVAVENAFGSVKVGAGAPGEVRVKINEARLPAHPRGGRGVRPPDPDRPRGGGRRAAHLHQPRGPVPGRPPTWASRPPSRSPCPPAPG